MERKVTLWIYVGAFFISLVVFLAGIFVGQTIESSAVEGIATDVTSVSQKVASLQLLMLLEGDTSSFCPVYVSELDAIDEEVELVGHRLSFLEEKKDFVDVELKKEYFVLQAQSYLLSKKLHDACGDDSTLLIHFYSNEKCEKCTEQGIDILKARDELSDMKLKLYSFDGTLGSPVADAFKKQYNVTRYPTLVINGQTYPGYKTVSEIKDLVEQ